MHDNKNYRWLYKFNIVNPLYLIIGKADGYIEENNENKYLIFTSTYGNKKVLAKFTKFWDEIKHFIETINESKKSEYEKYLLKWGTSENDLKRSKMT